MSRHLQHMRSRLLDLEGNPKQPTAQQIDYGEIAVNYRKDNETLFIKNDNDEIIPFYNGKVIEDNERVVAAAIADLTQKTQDIIEENELAIAAAVNDLNETIEQNELTTAGALTQLETTIEQNELVTAGALTQLSDTIEQNEQITAAALSNLDGRTTALETAVSGINTDHLTEIEYSDLVDLRDNGELVPGMYYRITDYETIVKQDDMEVYNWNRSAGNLFDVIVLALDENTLSENAYAAPHEGERYFDEANLGAWELKYTIDNDDIKYLWADSTNGKGVIYYMKDEWGNECPYDFKNIQFKRCKITGADPDIINTYYNGVTPSALSDCIGKYIGIIVGAWIEGDYQETVEVPGVPFGSLADTSDYKYMYTFSVSVDDGVSYNDASLINRMAMGADTRLCDNVTNNVILPLRYGVYRTGSPSSFNGSGISILTPGPYFGLNNIVFARTKPNDEDYNFSFFNNYFDESCGFMTFETSAFNNRFGLGSVFNVFLESFEGNTTGRYFRANTFSRNCKGNKFGDDVRFNYFETGFDYNVMGDSCFKNVFGSAERNTFGDWTKRNTFGYSFQSNHVGNGCMDNVIGYNCSYNEFKGDCLTINLGHDCNYNSFNTGCADIVLGDRCSNNTFCKNVHRFNALTTENGSLTNTPLSDIEFLTVEEGNEYIKLTTTAVNAGTEKLRNVTIAKGVNNDITGTTVKTISHNSLDDTFKTTYQPANSQAISV